MRAASNTQTSTEIGSLKINREVVRELRYHWMLVGRHWWQSHPASTLVICKRIPTLWKLGHALHVSSLSRESEWQMVCRLP